MCTPGRCLIRAPNSVIMGSTDVDLMVHSALVLGLNIERQWSGVTWTTGKTNTPEGKVRKAQNPEQETRQKCN